MVAVSRSAEVLRILERYLVEVVERHDLCPWARISRERHELAIGVLWGTPALDAWVAEARHQLAVPGARVAIVVAPELDVARAAFAQLRDRVAARLPTAGIAEFHPDAALDLASPARLVPFLRRAPDPLLQLVPLVELEAVRGPPPAADLADQARILGGHAAPPRRSVAARIADANHATAARAGDDIAEALAAIARDRARSYRRVGITSSR
jgi:hypothetical protein